MKLIDLLEKNLFVKLHEISTADMLEQQLHLCLGRSVIQQTVLCLIFPLSSVKSVVRTASISLRACQLSSLSVELEVSRAFDFTET